MKVLVVGASGQVGRAVVATRPRDVQVVAVTRADLDIRDASAVAATIFAERPQLIINAAAYTQVDRAEADPEATYQVNAVGPRSLAQSASKIGARLIHISTDFVFAGDSCSPYAPDAIANPKTVYGASKLQGERAVFEALGEGAVVVRTAWVYASSGQNFVRTMLKAMASRDRVGVVSDQVGTPTWADSLAHVLWAFAARPALTGVYHWTDDGVASWYDFAIAIQEEAVLRNLIACTAEVAAIRSEEYPSPARRPCYSVLDKRRTVAALGVTAVHWRSNLRRMLDELVAS